MSQERDNALGQIGAAFKDSVPLLENLLGIMDKQLPLDETPIINQIGGYLCHGKPCDYHQKEGKKILNMVKQFYKIT